MTAAEELELALRAETPLIALMTPEEDRAERRLILPAAAALREGRVYAWSATSDYVSLAGEAGLDAHGFVAPEPISALEVVAGAPEPALFVLKDFHAYLDSPALQRRLRDLARSLPGTGKHILFLGPRFPVPEDLEKEIQVIDYPPPGPDELGALLDELAGPDAGLTPAGRERLLGAALGLTLSEAAGVLRRAVARDGGITDAAVELVLAQKRQLVRRGGVLEFVESREGMEDVGGLQSLKGWLRRRRDAFTREAREFGLPVPRGVLLLGVQGCGKSLTARAVSREWGMPLVRLDVGRVFGRYIGDSEASMRRAIRTAEAAAPAVLWIDELEKGFAGATSEAHDTGVSARVMGTFLTWMQEKKQPVFVVATANQIRNLPAELLRKGRFDEIFFVDLPSAPERATIFAVHLRRRGRAPEAFDLPALAAQAEGFTGAEIEQVVGEALHTAFADGRRPLRQEDLAEAVGQVVPLSRTLRETIGAMRAWAETRARPAS